MCSLEIKTALVVFRDVRNRQKSLLQPGSHKVFIDNVWARVHGKREKRPSSLMADESEVPSRTQVPKKAKVAEPSVKVPNSSAASGSMVVPGPLCFSEDKPLTTDFTFFTTLQLQKCYLERGGGSRPGCPIGFPGLACKHCAQKDSERRFFYTSADHLRNSFSHIPSHLVECKYCPSEVKTTLGALKEVRHRQKSLLRPGSHKLFIDGVWDRVHKGEQVAMVSDKPSGETSSESKKRESPETDAEIRDRVGASADTNILVPVRGPLLPNALDISVESEASQSNYVEAIGPRRDTDTTIGEEILVPFQLLVPSDREMTTGYVFFSLQQMKPFFLAEQDAGRGDFHVGYPGLACRHCDGASNSRRFFNHAGSQFYNGFASIPNHVMVCSKTPQEVKDSLSSHRLMRPAEESKLKRGMHRQFMERVWGRLMSQDKRAKGATETTRGEPHTSARHKPVAIQTSVVKRTMTVALTSRPSALPTVSSSLSMPLANPAPTVSSQALVLPGVSVVNDDDKVSVTEFTYLTFKQVLSCSLHATGNGSRSSFTVGFPGLACQHCAGEPGARRFFYRTAEILAANYAHIPNHLLCCSKVPQELKRELEAKKTLHCAQKAKLQRGSQRNFFNRIWERVQGNRTLKADDKESGDDA